MALSLSLFLSAYSSEHVFTRPDKAWSHSTDPGRVGRGNVKANPSSSPNALDDADPAKSNQGSADEVLYRVQKHIFPHPIFLLSFSSDTGCPGNILAWRLVMVVGFESWVFAGHAADLRIVIPP